MLNLINRISERNEDGILINIQSFSDGSFSFANRTRRAIWNVIYISVVRPSPRPCHRWRATILRLFGARLGPDCHIYPKATIWAPWNLICEDHVGVADGVIIYNPSTIRLKSHSVISQEAYLCGASHDIDDPNFSLISSPIEVGAYAWICARATVQMGIKVGDGAVLALGAVATGDLEPWTVYGGVPAKKLKARKPILDQALACVPETLACD